LHHSAGGAPTYSTICLTFPLVHTGIREISTTSDLHYTSYQFIEMKNTNPLPSPPSPHPSDQDDYSFPDDPWWLAANNYYDR
jgi:hypothetical protein